VSSTSSRATVLALLAVGGPALSGCHRSSAPPLRIDQSPRADVLVVGAGVSGLAAAVEAAQSGATVVVVEASTVAGGHAILSSGAVALVDTPYQRSRQVYDSPTLAERDFLARGEDAHPGWVHAYVRDSKEWIYEWLTELGVEWEALIRAEGNSVPRLHRAKNKGIGLVEPLMRHAFRDPRITFLWATRADELIVSNHEVRGVRVTSLRSGTTYDLFGRSTVIATGGFQSNLERVLANWPPDLPRPGRLLIGAAHSATGTGHDMVVSAGGTVGQLDHQWNYVLGFPDPRDPSGQRGLAAFNLNSIWVNREGRRFTREFGDEKKSLRALLQQAEGRYWSVFDERAKGAFSITLAGWERFEDVRRVAFESGLILSAPTIEDLAARMQADPFVLRSTVDRFNLFVANRRDEDFGRFDHSSPDAPGKIETAPFYAAPFFPITRKSMGGIRVDERARVLEAAGIPIANLFAVGEVTGFAGINGKAALEGTFLGPGIYMGRVAGRAAAIRSGAGERRRRQAVVLRGRPSALVPGSFDDRECLSCHDVGAEVKRNRPAFWHFEQSHAKVLDRRYACAQCHSDMAPYTAAHHHLNRAALLYQCVTCHGVQSNAAPRPE
jgi:predicted oxidoreductase